MEGGGGGEREGRGKGEKGRDNVSIIVELRLKYHSLKAHTGTVNTRGIIYLYW